MNLIRLLAITILTVTAIFLPTEQAVGLAATGPRAVVPAPANSGAAIIRVPGDTTSLQTAIGMVSDGGIIELAGGTYPSPANGFQIFSVGKGFTIRAQAGQQVVLDGGSSRPILHFYNPDPALGRPVVFQGLTFDHGWSNADTIAGAVTVRQAIATFVDCTFQNSHGNQPATGGGGVYVTDSSIALFVRGQWLNNSDKNEGGALDVQSESRVYIHASRFVGNRTNKTGHRDTSAGGAIHVGNSLLRVSNSRFEANEAGYVGGAIYAIGTWRDPTSTPRADIIVANSTFVNNMAYSATPFGAPTEGGAIHGEDQTRLRIYTSRFINNQSNVGGGVNLYRATAEIENSLFQGNKATGQGSANGFGAAVSAVSNDNSADGGTNRPAASLTIRDSAFIGLGATPVSQTAGGIYAAGDHYRMYGSWPIGDLAANRAHVLLERLLISDMQVQELPGAGGTGHGAGFVFGLVDLTVNGGLVLRSHAAGATNSLGGGGALLGGTLAHINGTVIANNVADKFGGGLFIQGTETYVQGAKFWGNALNPIVSDSCLSYGAAIYSSPALNFGNLNLPTNEGVRGSINDSLFAANNGLPFSELDVDLAGHPSLINDLRYNGNRVHSATYGQVVFTTTMPGQCSKTVAQLNALTISRPLSGTSTKKSQVANTWLSSPPSDAGAIVAAPKVILPAGATGDATGPTSSMLAFTWAAGSATLDGSPVSGAGLWPASAGTHTLSVGGASFTDAVTAVPAPTIGFLASITPVSSLSWQVFDAQPLDLMIDQGVTAPVSGQGSVVVPAIAGRSYYIYTITTNGGAVATATMNELYLPLKTYLPLVVSGR